MLRLVSFLTLHCFPSSKVCIHVCGCTLGLEDPPLSQGEQVMAYQLEKILELTKDSC
jgi:hypothetical protein